MDRRTERRLAVLKRWRSERAHELELDPGVLCPNSTLEEIAFENPTTAHAVQRTPGVKPWFGRSFGAEVARSLRDLEASAGS